MENCRPVNTPMITKEAERKNEKRDQNVESEKIEYREAIGSLMYLANSTQPDLTYSVNFLSRKQSNYTYEDWVAVKRVLRYLQGTKNMGLIYRGIVRKDEEGNSRADLECFVDASLGMNDDEGKSTSGYLIRLFGDVLTWGTKRQTHVALSSAESEFIAMSLASRELTSIREMCKRLLKLNFIPVMMEDNTSVINMAKTEDPQSLKHIVKLCYHHIHLEMKMKNVILKWVPSIKQQADFFTKPLGETKFIDF